MADTSRTKAELLTLFADNITGDISEQDMRDFIASVFDEYGSLQIKSGVTAQSVSATPQKLINWSSIGPSLGVVPDFANNEFTIGTDGIYEGVGMFMFSGSANKTYVMAMYADVGSGWVDGGAPKIIRKLGTGGDVGSASICVHASVSAGDKLSTFIWSTDGGTTVTIHEATIMLKRIG